MPEFTRFTETITKKQNKRVINITVKPTITDCTGSVWFTDLMLQEGDKVTGFVINTGTATCADVLALTDEIRATVLRETGIALELEIRRLG